MASMKTDPRLNSHGQQWLHANLLEILKHPDHKNESRKWPKCRRQQDENQNSELYFSTLTD